ncbi:MAG: hypothetical protein KC619_12070 [Myxococcales bacterium]|nr:hypothetical protein [Myxococcales bacterium]
MSIRVAEWVLRTSLLSVLLSVPLSAAPAAAQEEVSSEEAEAAVERIRARCASVLDTIAEAGEEVDAYRVNDLTVEPTRIRLVESLYAVGNATDSDGTRGLVVDLQTCDALLSEQRYETGAASSTFVVFAIGAHVLRPLPAPPGRAYGDDPALAAARAALSTECETRGDHVQDGLRISGPLAPLQPWVAGPPRGAPPTHAAVEALRAIGARPRPRPEGPGRFVRVYRTSLELPAPRSVRRVGTDEVFVAEMSGMYASSGIAIRDTATDRSRWVFFGGCLGSRIRWLGGDEDVQVGVGLPSEEQLDTRPTVFALSLRRGVVLRITPEGEDDFEYDGEMNDPPAPDDPVRLVGRRLELDGVTDSDDGPLSITLDALTAVFDGVSREATSAAEDPEEPEDDAAEEVEAEPEEATDERGATTSPTPLRPPERASGGCGCRSVPGAFGSLLGCGGLVVGLFALRGRRARR